MSFPLFCFKRLLDPRNNYYVSLVHATSPENVGIEPHGHGRVRKSQRTQHPQPWGHGRRIFKVQLDAQGSARARDVVISDLREKLVQLQVAARVYARE